jgi:single-strand DNA-binding protein
MPEVNSVIIAGNLTKDPVLRTTRSGTPVANFTIACNRKFRDGENNMQEDVCFIGVVAWNRLAENCSSKLAKGSAVLVEGELQSKVWNQDDGTSRSAIEIKARRIQFLSRWKERSGHDDGDVDDDFRDDTDSDRFDRSRFSSMTTDGYAGPETKD